FCSAFAAGRAPPRDANHNSPTAPARERASAATQVRFIEFLRLVRVCPSLSTSQAAPRFAARTPTSRLYSTRRDPFRRNERMSADTPDGLLVVDKPGGMTSRAAVDRALRWFPRRTKIGHTGTLDPLATGVLVLCLGGATRLAEYVQRMAKTYRSTFRL